MNSPLSFVPDEQQAQASSSFVPDQQAVAPKSFQPDSSSPVVFQNRTAQQDGMSWQEQGNQIGLKDNNGIVQSNEATRSIKDVANAPLVLLGNVMAGLMNQMADKGSPDIQQQKAYPGASHYRSGLQQRLFGPSNLAVLGKDPNQVMFKQGQSVLPEQQSVIGSDSDARRMLEGTTTPEGIGSAFIAPTRLGPLVTGMYGASTAANLNEMKPADITANALMMGLPMAKSLHEAMTANQISRSAPTVKEESQVPLPNELPKDIALPRSTTESIIPEGGDNSSGMATVSKQATEPASRGTLSLVDLGRQLGLTVKQWDPSIPVLGGSFSLTDPKTGMTVENLRPGVSAEEVQQRMAEKNKFPTVQGQSLYEINGKKVHPTAIETGLSKAEQQVEQQHLSHVMNDESGSVGLHVLNPEVWKELGFKAKTEGQQFINRLRNKLGGESAGWKMIDTPEFQQFMKSGPKTTQEVQDFVNKNRPKVEVRKFGSVEQTKNERKLSELQHKLDTDFKTGNMSVQAVDLRRRIDNLRSQVHEERLNDTRPSSHWQSIAPKSEQDMPGYTEIAVVKSLARDKSVTTEHLPEGKSYEQFPSSHSFPPNTLGFVRGYMETTPQGKKVFHVIEVQSDWAQAQREAKQEFMEKGLNAGRLTKEQLEVEYEKKPTFAHDPLLPHYERLALKAAIDHAREQGADAIAISDAETAMMTEGHDRVAAQTGFDPDYPEEVDYNKVEVPQSQGMKLHYDKTLPKIAEELTGEKGTRESFGEHKMSWSSTGDPEDWAGQPQPDRFRKDLIFRNESGQPKTDISARVYPITKAAKDFSIIGKDKPRQVGKLYVGITETPQRGLERIGQHAGSLGQAKQRIADLGEKGSIKEVEAPKNPLRVTDDEANSTDLLAEKLGLRIPEEGTSPERVVNELRKRGYDGLVYENTGEGGGDSYVILGKNKVGNQGVTSESGMIDLSGARESLDKGIENLKEFFSDEGIRRKTMKMAGVSVPRTTAANEKVGNQLTMFAQAEGVAEAKARSMASEVLGKHWKDKDFDAKLGAVGVEDQLRTLKAQLLAAGKTAEAQSVNTVVGQPYSPIKSEAQYQQLKNAPEIKAALARHIATVQGLAEQKQTALKGAIRSVGQDTGSFFNLIAKGVDNGEIRKARQGNTLATLKGGTRFGKEFKGTGAEYETSYRKMAERMVKGNWTEVEKQKLFELVDSTGFGRLQKAGEDLPTFDKPMSPIPVQRKMAVIIKPGDKPIMKSQNETLWVPKSSAEEFRQAFQTDSPLKEGLIKNISSVVTKVQTGLGADAAFHVGNMAAAVVTSPEKATAVKLMVQNLAKTFETNPEVQRKLAAMAEEAGIVREGETEVAAWKKLIPGKNMISWADQAGRLTLDKLYQDAVKRGESPNNPVWRRAAVQGALGEYNKRLMPKVQQIMKESGLSPFLTAGKTFNRLSVRQLMLSPGRKAANVQGGAKMRLKQALYTTGLVVALPMIINNAMTGHPFPQGVEPGQFVVKKNEDGSYVVEDIAQLLMMRRGMRNTGIQAVAHGIEDKQSVGQIAKQATKDVARGIVRPFAGPTVSAADTVTGGGLLMDKPNKPIRQRIGEAVKQANPTAEVFLNKDESKTTNEKLIGRFGRTIGLKVTQTGVSRINGLARDWKERNGVALDNSPRGPYFDLTSALRKNDAQGARKALASVGLADKKDELIKQYYDNIATKPFTDSNEHEKQFVSQLSEEDKKVYQSVKDSNAQVRERFYNIFMGRPAPRLPREGREERPARENKFLPR